MVLVAAGLGGGAYALAAGGGGAPRGRLEAAPSAPAPPSRVLAEGQVPVPAPSSVDRTVPLAPITPGAAAPVNAPARVTIAAIGVNAPVVPLGIAADGTLNPPADFTSVGWWAGGPAPGAVGPSVLAAHVDSTAGPAVFWRLRDLVAGDVVRVTDSVNVTTSFTVTSVAQYPKAQFPTAAVYGANPRPVLRLVTCGGTFNHATGHYRDNIVVYAVATGS